MFNCSLAVIGVFFFSSKLSNCFIINTLVDIYEFKFSPPPPFPFLCRRKKRKTLFSQLNIKSSNVWLLVCVSRTTSSNSESSILAFYCSRRQMINVKKRGFVFVSTYRRDRLSYAKRRITCSAHWFFFFKWKEKINRILAVKKISLTVAHV